MSGKVKKYKVAVIGCGNIGADKDKYNSAVQPGSHAHAYQLNPQTELIALVEPTQERWSYLEQNYSGVKIYSTAQEMYKNTSLDIVSITTPSQFHYNDVLHAAQNKIPVILCEKPISYSLTEAEEMVQKCKKNNCKLFVNHQRHFDPLLNKWANKIKEGFLGDIHQGHAYYYNGFFNNGTHLMDLLLMFLGEVESVVGQYNDITSMSDDKNIDGVIKFKNGAFVSLHSLSKNYGHFGFALFGEKGMLEITNLGFEVRYRKKEDNEKYKGFYQLSSEEKVEGKPRSMIKSTIEHIISVIDGVSKAKCTGEDASSVLKILQDIKLSASKIN